MFQTILPLAVSLSLDKHILYRIPWRTGTTIIILYSVASILQLRRGILLQVKLGCAEEEGIAEGLDE